MVKNDAIRYLLGGVITRFSMNFEDVGKLFEVITAESEKLEKLPTDEVMNQLLDKILSD
jgi:hypothetical protein